MAKDIILKL